MAENNAGECYQWQGDTLILRLRLQPGASRNGMLGPWGAQSLRISVKARPVDGKANAELLAFIAECFGVHARAVKLQPIHEQQHTIPVKLEGLQPEMFWLKAVLRLNIEFIDVTLETIQLLMSLLNSEFANFDDNKGC